MILPSLKQSASFFARAILLFGSGYLSVTFSLILLVLASNSALAQPDLIITDLSIHGNESFSQSEITDLMTIKTPGWLSRVIFGKERTQFDEDLVRENIEILRTFYQKEGFLHVVVREPDVKIDEEDGTVSIKYQIDEHKPVSVSEIVIDHQPGQTPTGRLIDSIASSAHLDFTLRIGERFRDELAKADERTMTGRFVNSGYPYAKIARTLTMNRNDSTVAVRWKIDPGIAVTFGVVTQINKEEVEEGVIERRLRFSEGETFNADKLQQSQKDIYDLAIYNSVTFKPRFSEEKSAVVPIDIITQYSDDYQTRFGVGYGKEDKFRGFVKLQWFRAFGGARRVDLTAKHSALQPYDFSLVFTQPDLIFVRTNFIINPFLVNEDEPGYTSRRFGGSFALRNGHTGLLVGGVALSYEDIDEKSKSISSTTADSGIQYKKWSLSLGLNMDHSSPLFNPDKGTLLVLGLSLNRLDQHGVESNFIKLTIEERVYYRANDWFVPAARLKIGAIGVKGDSGFLPTDQKFFSGGSSSVRGYPRSSLGPVDASNTPLGGQSLLEGSVEGRFEIVGSWGFVLFGDFGNVWEHSLTYSLSELQYAAGAGLRFDTPVGPVRFDLAYPIFSGSQKPEFYFSIGQMF